MRGDAHRQRQGALCTSRFRTCHRPLQSWLVTGDHDLARTIIVRHLDDLVGRACVRTDFIQGRDIHAEDGSHPTRSELPRPFHQFAARPYQSQPILE